MAIIKDHNSGNFVTSTTSSPLIWTHTVGSGANIFIFVGVALYADSSHPTTIGVTCANTPMFKIRSDNADNGLAYVETSLWLLHAPAIGDNTIAVSFSGGTNTICHAGAVDYFNAQQYEVDDGNSGISLGDTGPGTLGGFARHNFVLNLETEGAWIALVAIDAIGNNTIIDFTESTSIDGNPSVPGTIRWNTGVGSTGQGSANDYGLDFGPYSIIGTSRNAIIPFGATPHTVLAMSAAAFSVSGLLPNLSPGVHGVNDSVSTSEFIGINEAFGIYCFDSANFNESFPTRLLVEQNIRKSDTATTGEGVTVSAQAFTIIVSDIETVSDSQPQISEILNINVFDLQPTVEFQKLLNEQNINVFDQEPTSEFAQGLIANLIISTQHETSMIEEFLTLLSVTGIDVIFQYEVVSDSEFTQVFIPILPAIKSDVTSTTEFVSIFTTELFIQKSDTTTISESIQSLGAVSITVNDLVITNEYLDIIRNNTRDAITVDLVQISEFTYAQQSDYFRAVQDTVGTTDVARLSGPITLPKVIVYKEIIEFTANTHIFLILVMD